MLLSINPSGKGEQGMTRPQLLVGCLIVAVCVLQASGDASSQSSRCLLENLAISSVIHAKGAEATETQLQSKRNMPITLKFQSAPCPGRSRISVFSIFAQTCRRLLLAPGGAPTPAPGPAPARCFIHSKEFCACAQCTCVTCTHCLILSHKFGQDLS